LGLTRITDSGPSGGPKSVRLSSPTPFGSERTGSDRDRDGRSQARKLGLRLTADRPGLVGEASGSPRGDDPSGARRFAPNEEKGGGFVRCFLVDRETCGRAEGGVGRPAPNKRTVGALAAGPGSRRRTPRAASRDRSGDLRSGGRRGRETRAEHFDRCRRKGPGTFRTSAGGDPSGARRPAPDPPPATTTWASRRDREVIHGLVLNGFARFWEGEPPCEPAPGRGSDGASPSGITQDDLEPIATLKGASVSSDRTRRHDDCGPGKSQTSDLHGHENRSTGHLDGSRTNKGSV
jgi:hypothetical protein